MSKKPTSFDVARLAGVHRSQVSRALNGQGRMSDQTRQNILDAADQLGYRVNFLARGLNAASRLIGIVVSRLDTPFRAAQLRAAASELQAHDYTPILVMAEQQKEVDGLVERLLNYSVSGMIITSGTPPRQIIDECARLDVPVTLINRTPAEAAADRVAIDVQAAGRLAYDMLSAGGARRFAVLEPADQTYSVLGRVRAFADLCRAAGHPVQVLPTAGQSYEAGLGAAARFAAAPEAEAVFCPEDLTALGFLDGLRHRHGVGVPDQVQVLGFDDIPAAGWLGNNLSTIRQDTQGAAITAAQLVLKRIEDPARPHETHDIALHPVRRGTTLGAQNDG